MRNLPYFLPLALLISACAAESGDLCLEAAAHIEECTGQEIPAGDTCDEELAEEFLSLSCEQIAASGGKGDWSEGEGYAPPMAFCLFTKCYDISGWITNTDGQPQADLQLLVDEGNTARKQIAVSDWRGKFGFLTAAELEDTTIWLEGPSGEVECGSLPAYASRGVSSLQVHVYVDNNDGQMSCNLGLPAGASELCTVVDTSIETRIRYSVPGNALTEAPCIEEVHLDGVPTFFLASTCECL